MKKFKKATLNFGGSSKDFPTEKEVLTQFYKKNNLPLPKSSEKTSLGIIAYSKGYHILLYTERSHDNSNSLFKSQTTKYGLEGKIGNKLIKLETNITHSTSYKRTMVPTENPRPMVQERQRMDEENSWISTNRIDNNTNYWFLEDFDSKRK